MTWFSRRQASASLYICKKYIFKKLNERQGGTLYTTLLSLVVLGVMSATLTQVTATSMKNNEARFASSQAYYTALAGAEYSLMKFKNGETPSDMGFAGGSFQLTQTGDKLNIDGSRNDRYSKVSLVSDYVDLGRCLVINISGAHLNLTNDRVEGITLDKSASCAGTITVSFFRGEWSTVGGRKIREISIDGGVVWSNMAGADSKQEIDINDVVLDGGSPIAIDYLEFNAGMDSENLVTMFRLNNSGMGYSGSRRSMQANNLQQ